MERDCGEERRGERERESRGEAADKRRRERWRAGGDGKRKEAEEGGEAGFVRRDVYSKMRGKAQTIDDHAARHGKQ